MFTPPLPIALRGLRQQVGKLRRVRDRLANLEDGDSRLAIVDSLTERIGGIEALVESLEVHAGQPSDTASRDTEAAFIAAAEEVFGHAIGEDVPSEASGALDAAVARSTRCPSCGRVGCTCDCEVFKVGDRVRVVQVEPLDAAYGIKVGQVGTVISVCRPINMLYVELATGFHRPFSFGQLEPADLPTVDQTLALLDDGEPSAAEVIEFTNLPEARKAAHAEVAHLCVQVQEADAADLSGEHAGQVVS